MAIACTSKAAKAQALAAFRSSIASDKFMEETQWKQVEVPLISDCCGWFFYPCWWSVQGLVTTHYMYLYRWVVSIMIQRESPHSRLPKWTKRKATEVAKAANRLSVCPWESTRFCPKSLVVPPVCSPRLITYGANICVHSALWDRHIIWYIYIFTNMISIVDRVLKATSDLRFWNGKTMP